MNRWWIASMILLAGCAAQHSPPCCAKGSPHLVHVVICWLKTPGDEQSRQKLIEASRNFQGKTPGLICVSAGRMLPSTRPAVDTTYDLGIVMTFVDEKALINYGKSPLHQQALRDVLKPLVDHYVVYDFVAK